MRTSLRASHTDGPPKGRVQNQGRQSIPRRQGTSRHDGPRCPWPRSLLCQRPSRSGHGFIAIPRVDRIRRRCEDLEDDVAAGKADFHSLAPTNTGVYGYNSLTSMLMYSGDGKKWIDLFRGAVYDTAVDPNDSDHLLLTTEAGLRDYQRGSEPELRAETSGVALTEWADGRTVVGLTADGKVEVSTDTGKSWSLVGRVKGGIEAPGTSSTGWQVATADGVFESTDEGKSWRRILDQP